MTTSDVTRILERLATIEQHISAIAPQDERLQKLEAVVNKMLGALILLGASGTITTIYTIVSH